MRISDWSSDVCSSDLHELHRRPGHAEYAIDLCRTRGVAIEELLDQLRQHRNDDAERHHVEHDRDEDEDQCAASRGGWCCGVHAISPSMTRSGQCHDAGVCCTMSVSHPPLASRKSVGEGKGVAVREDTGGGSTITKKK